MCAQRSMTKKKERKKSDSWYAEIFICRAIH